MEPFYLSDADVLIGLVGLSIGAYCLYLKYRIDGLDRIIAEKEAALNAPEQQAPAPR